MARGLETSRREVSLATIHPAGLLPRRVQKLDWFTRQLHRREVVAVAWKPQNSSPMVCVWRWNQKNRPVCRFIGNCSSAIAAGENLPFLVAL